jgi:hypothetical protein
MNRGSDKKARIKIQALTLALYMAKNGATKESAYLFNL